MVEQFQAQKDTNMATEKLDLRSRPSKSVIMADLRKRLTEAQKKIRSRNRQQGCSKSGQVAPNNI